MQVLREVLRSLRASPIFAFYLLVTLVIAGVIGLMTFQPDLVGMGWMGHFGSASHRVHDLTFGFLFTTGVVGVLAQLRRPSKNVAGMLMALIPWAGLLLAAALSTDVLRVVLFNPSPSVAAVTVIVVILHPTGRDFFRSFNVSRVNWVKLALVGVAAVPLLTFASTNIGRQGSFLDDHAGMGHYGFMAAFSFTVIGVGLLASLRPDGWRLTAWVAGLLPVLLGLTSVIYPDAASSLSLVWALAAIAWGFAFVAAAALTLTTVRDRGGDAQADRSLDPTPASRPTGMQPATQPSKPPLGGRRGDWRHRFLRFHVPLALASALVLVLFMTLPFFDAGGGRTLDMGSSGAFPQMRQRGEGGSMVDGGEHGGRQVGSAEDSGEHGGRQGGASDHGGRQAGSMDPDEGHGGEARPMDPDERRRSRHELGGVNTARLTIATGYVATGLLALTLLIGPANLLLRRRNPVSTYLARDVGTWAAIFSVVHVIFGLQVHGTGRLSGFLNYFVAPDGSPLLNSFGLGNWTGLAATVLVVGLFAISNNFALRKLKAKRWKRIQRLNYGLFALVILHAYFYGALLRMTSPFTLLLLVSVIAVLVGQAAGIWLWRRKYGTRAVRQTA